MEEINLRELMSILWRKKHIVLIIILIFIIFGSFYSYKIVKPVYKSSTTLILGRINSSNVDGYSGIQDTNQITQSEITINSNLVSTYSELIKSKSLTQEVKNNLNIDIEDEKFTKNITVSRKAETELIEITVINEDPLLAANIANEIAKVFSSKIEEIYNISNVYIIDRAIEDDKPYNINHVKDIAIFSFLGIIASVSYVIIYSLIDTTIKTPEDIEKEIDLKNLISIPVRKEKSKNKELKELIVYEEANSIISEVFKTLRTNVQFSNINNKDKKVMLITSCFSSEGKSYISSNLAIAFAQAGKKVILIDADMRRGRQSKIFRLPNELGLSNFLSNLDNNGMEINERVNKYINETGIKNLNVITSGNVPPNPSELLTSNKLPELIKELSIFYDLIIFDGAPVLPIADSLILARLANSTILVSLYNKTKKDELLKAKKDIQNVGGRIIGAILNKVPVSNYEYENKYYYYKKDEEKPKKHYKNKEKVKKENNFIKNVKSKFEHIKYKVERFFEDILRKRLKNKIKLLAEGNKKELSILDENRTIEEYEQELKKLEKEKQEKVKTEQKQKKVEQEKIEAERQKAREELVKKKEDELNNLKNKNEESKKQQEEIKRQEEKNNDDKNIEEKTEEQKTEEQKNEEEKIKEEQKKIEDEEKAKIKEEKRKKREETKAKIKEDIKEKTEILKEKLNQLSAKFNDFKNQTKEKIQKSIEENKIKSQKNKEIRKENRKKQKELKLEKDRAYKEEKERKAKEDEIRKEELKIEKERQKEINDAEKQERQKEIEKEKQIKLEKKLEEKIKKAQSKEERKSYREKEKQRQKEEERIKEEILEDNLYPKTKYYKDL